MKKPSRVFFHDAKLKNTFDLLDDEDPLKKGMIKAIQDLKKNCLAGETVKKDSVILKNYKKKYDATNLRVYDLPLAYRLMYTIVNEEIDIVSVILDWKSHKEYDKLNKRRIL